MFEVKNKCSSTGALGGHGRMREDGEDEEEALSKDGRTKWGETNDPGRAHGRSQDEAPLGQMENKHLRSRKTNN